MSAHRPGDVRLLVDGAPKTLRLTLGALARIEAELCGGDLSALETRLAKPSVADLIALLAALIEGGGETISIEALRRADIDMGDAARAVAAVFAALGKGAS
jgi:hypothetical protein